MPIDCYRRLRVRRGSCRQSQHRRHRRQESSPGLTGIYKSRLRLNPCLALLRNPYHSSKIATDETNARPPAAAALRRRARTEAGSPLSQGDTGVGVEKIVHLSAVVFFRPSGALLHFLRATHGVRRGLHSFAASRLLLEDLHRCG